MLAIIDDKDSGFSLSVVRIKRHRDIFLSVMVVRWIAHGGLRLRHGKILGRQPKQGRYKENPQCQGTEAKTEGAIHVLASIIGCAIRSFSVLAAETCFASG